MPRLKKRLQNQDENEFQVDQEIIDANASDYYLEAHFGNGFRELRAKAFVPNEILDLVQARKGHQFINHPGFYQSSAGYRIDQSCGVSRGGRRIFMIQYEIRKAGLLQPPAQPGAGQPLTNDQNVNFLHKGYFALTRIRIPSVCAANSGAYMHSNSLMPLL